MSDSQRIVCGERLSIDQIEALYAEMEQALSQGGDIELDIDQVIYADTAGLQLLLVLSQALEKTGNQVVWLGESEALANCGRYLGLSAALALPQMAAA